ncbi:MAG: FMN-binding protein [Longimicrobiales bacterium]
MALLITPRLVASVLLWSVALVPAMPTAAQTVTQEDALRLAFPGADAIQRRTAYLDEAQLAQASSLAGSEAEVESGVVTYYLATKDGSPVGAAYFDAHRVRTLPEVLMFVVGIDHRIRRIEVVRFSEPPEYAPPRGWLGQFADRALEADLSHKRGIANITGATLTARAVTSASRRVLALHQVLAPFAGGTR